MTVKERLIKFIKTLQIGQGAFEKAVGLSNGYVNNIRQSIQPDKLQKIALCYPELNTGWLITGEGEMLKTSPSNNEETLTQRELFDQISRLTETVLNQQKIISSQQNTIEGLRLTIKELHEKRDSAARPGAATSAIVG